ncbi:predicted protein [Nematostella vectensis]|uniref:BTB domain-containing protein n=2 Tax=Nematostella vectensis TaxID=45351 RepID=A7RPP2_NEMVE|nr:predicted protein [Nematostella vectensis]|eukprot:XP_001638605.1 predicted protein [Nematostella vectensis]
MDPSIESPNEEKVVVPPYKNNEHCNKAFQVMNSLRQQNMLCDVVLKAGSIEIPAHRVVLASSSPYFFAMFTGELSESRQTVVTLKEIDSLALELLIEFVYIAEIEVTEDNVQVLLPAANLLQLNEVRDACCDFLKAQLHPSNCLGIRAFADMHSCPDLLRTGHIFAEQHFSEVVQGDEFLGLPFMQVAELISSDQLTVPSEEKVFEAVVRWVGHDPEHRHECLALLMEHVRLPLLSREYLVSRVETELMIKNSVACKDFLIEALKYHLLTSEQRSLLQTPRTRPRTPIGMPKVMFVVGGQAPKAIRSVECYDFKGERWYPVAEMNSRRCRAGVSVLDGLVYAVGGFNGSLRVRTVDCYDPIKDQWRPAASMEARRSTLGAAVLNGLLYAIGGFDGTTGLNTCEVYDPKLNEWRPIAPMSTRRSSVGVGVLNGLLYAVGGYDGGSRHCLSSVECYSPANNEWTLVPEMSTRRSGAGVGVAYGVLYAIGGHDGPHVRKSVECFNVDLNTWKPVAEMSMCRRNAGVASVNGLLFVVGGDDGSTNLASVEVYNPRTDQWGLLPSCMSIGRSYAGVAVIDRPNNT